MLNLQKLQRVVFKLNFYIKIIIRGGGGWGLFYAKFDIVSIGAQIQE